MNYEQSAKAQTERLMADGHATILAIESSCDETAAAIVRDGRQVISSVISSQIPLHAMYGGVVPEIASRAHVESVDPVVDEALKKAGMTLSDVDAVAVTYGPGLVGALLIGVSAAKALAYAAGKPLVPVNHIEGHVSANYVAHPDLEPPFVCLVASGGHSHIVRVEDYGVYTLLGQTFVQAGKDLTAVRRVVATGGSLIHSPRVREIASYFCYDPADPASLRPKNAEILIDSSYILAAMGLLSTHDPLAALQIMKRMIR